MPGDRSQILQAAFLLDPEKGRSQAEGSSLTSYIWAPPLANAPVPITGTMIPLLGHLHEHLPVINIFWSLLLILYFKSV